MKLLNLPIEMEKWRNLLEAQSYLSDIYYRQRKLEKQIKKRDEMRRWKASLKQKNEMLVSQ